MTWVPILQMRKAKASRGTQAEGCTDHSRKPGAHADSHAHTCRASGAHRLTSLKQQGLSPSPSHCKCCRSCMESLFSLTHTPVQAQAHKCSHKHTLEKRARYIQMCKATSPPPRRNTCTTTPRKVSRALTLIQTPNSYRFHKKKHSFSFSHV